MDRHEVVFVQRPVDGLDAFSVALNELGEGIGSLPRFSEVLDALIRPVDEAYERGHGSSLPERAPDLSLGTHAHSHTECKAAHSLLMLLARSRIETTPTKASASITGRCRNPPESI